MPFTPVHTIINLPFIRLKPEWVSATALIIGSMAPDIEYFLKMNDIDHYGHTWLGSILFDIPVTILSAFIFHLIVKKNLINNLPVFFQRRFQQLLNFDFLTYFKKNYITFIISAWLGTMSHFFLDAMTHGGGYFVEQSWYPKTLFIIDGLGFPFFYVLQNVLSLVGMVVLVFYLVYLSDDESAIVNPRPSLLYWVLFALVSAAIVALHYSISRIQVEIPNLVISTIAAFLAALIVCGFFKFDSSLLPGQGRST